MMICGNALDANNVATPMRLHWTVAQDVPLKKSLENYRPCETDYDLPELFWHDLGDILSFLAATGAAEFDKRPGQFVVDELEVFIPRARALVASTKVSAANVAKIQIVLADSLSTYGTQRGDFTALGEAVSAYREALQKRIRERVPLQWATTQNDLKLALQALERKKQP